MGSSKGDNPLLFGGCLLLGGGEKQYVRLVGRSFLKEKLDSLD